MFGDASNAEVLDETHLETARIIVVAIPDAHAARLIVRHAREVNPSIALVVRAHDHRLLTEMTSMGGSVHVIHGEVELGRTDDPLHTATLRRQQHRGRGHR